MTARAKWRTTYIKESASKNKHKIVLKSQIVYLNYNFHLKKPRKFYSTWHWLSRRGPMLSSLQVISKPYELARELEEIHERKLDKFTHEGHTSIRKNLLFFNMTTVHFKILIYLNYYENWFG